MLDAVFAKRGENDPGFQQRLHQAITAELLDKEPQLFGLVSPPSSLEQRIKFIKTHSRSTEVFVDRARQLLSTGDIVLFNAYTKNPGGRARPEDLAEAGIRGWGNDVGVINDLYDGFRARYGEGTPDYDAAVRDLDRNWADRYNGGKGSLDEHLRTDELSAKDSRAYMGARLGDPDIVEFYDGSHGLGHNGGKVMTALMANINRTQEFADDYTKIAGASNRASLNSAKVLDHDIRASMKGSELTRALTLTDTTKSPDERAMNYVRATLKAYQAGDVKQDAVLQALRTFAPHDGLLKPSAIAAAMRPELDEARAKAATGPEGGVLTAQIDSVTSTGAIDTPKVAAAEIRSMLDTVQRGAPANVRSGLVDVARKLRMLNPEERAAVQAELGSDPFTAYMTRGARPAIYRVPDHGIVDELNSALAGTPETPEQVLSRATTAWPTADGSDVLAAINRTPYLARGALRSQAWDAMVSKLPDDVQRQIRTATSLPAHPDQVDAMLEHVKKLGADEQSGIAGWMGEQFGFSGPIARNALRELVQAAQNVREVTSADDPRLRELALAHQSFVRTLETQAGERQEIAENAQFYATLAVGFATVGYGFTTAGIIKAALTVGGTAVASKYATLGAQHYTPEEATRDFILNAGMDAAGVGLFKGLGATFTAVKPPVAKLFKPRI